jgi:hypothetical protein
MYNIKKCPHHISYYSNAKYMKKKTGYGGFDWIQLTQDRV